MSLKNQAQNHKQSFKLHKATQQIEDLIKQFEHQYGLDLDISLNEFLYIVIRLSDSVQKDSRFTGGWDNLTREVRRRLYNKLNMFSDDKSNSSDGD